MSQTPETDLPDGAAALIALARVAHYQGDRALEQSARDRLTRDYGISLSFICAVGIGSAASSAFHASGRNWVSPSVSSCGNSGSLASTLVS